MDLIPLTLDREAAYEGFLRGRTEAMLYYSLHYARFLAALLRCRLSYWLAEEHGEIQGVLPLMECDGPYGIVRNSLPFYGSNGGVLASTPAATTALVRQYNRLAREATVAAATWICNPLAPAPDTTTLTFDLTDNRIAQFSDLAPWRTVTTAEPAPPFLTSSARRNVRKAVAAGVTVRTAGAEALPFVEACHRENLAAIGGRAKTPAFFALLPEYFTAGTDYHIYVAEVDGEPVSALLLFDFNGTVEYYTPVTRHEARPLQPMALILATAMRDAAARGGARWNWGGTWTSQSGVYKFKRKWGATDQPYHYYIAVNNRDLYALTPARVREAYGDFYVLPFSVLTGSAEASSS